MRPPTDYPIDSTQEPDAHQAAQQDSVKRSRRFAERAHPSGSPPITEERVRQAETYPGLDEERSLPIAVTPAEVIPDNNTAPESAIRVSEPAVVTADAPEPHPATQVPMIKRIIQSVF